jgi:hypothetical protein
MATRYQRQQAVRRRTSDITRLGSEYSRSLAEIAARQDQAMSAYAGLVSEIEGRNAQRISSFEGQQREFDAQRSSYDSAQAQYNEYIKSFLTRTDGSLATVRDWTSGRLPDSQKYFETDYDSLFFLPEGVSRSFFNKSGSTSPAGLAMSSALQYVGAPGGTGYLRLRRDDGSFTDKAPEQFTQRSAPTFSATEPKAPELEQLPAFDDGEFAAARNRADERLQREVAERKGARLNVARRRDRTMLSGATS